MIFVVTSREKKKLARDKAHEQPVKSLETLPQIYILTAQNKITALTNHMSHFIKI